MSVRASLSILFPMALLIQSAIHKCWQRNDIQLNCLQMQFHLSESMPVYCTNSVQVSNISHLVQLEKALMIFETSTWN